MPFPRSLLTLALCLLHPSSHALSVPVENKSSGYQLPPVAMQAIVDAPRAPALHLSPQRSMAALVQNPSLPSIAQVAQTELKLAGMRIHPRTYSASRFMFGKDIWLLDLASKEEIRIQGLPSKLALMDLHWSPDQRYLAFTHLSAEGVELWLIDVQKRQARKASPYFLNTVAGNGFHWLPDSQQLLLHIKPPRLGPAPAKIEVPTGPNIQVSDAQGKQRQLRTFPDLLKNENDAQIFDHYLTQQLLLLDVKGSQRMVGSAERYSSVKLSPDGKYLLTQILQRPYSYVVPAQSFAQKFEIRDLQGKLVHALGQRTLQEGLPPGFDSVPIGMRNLSWRADAPASVVWAEALDGGDSSQAAKLRDKVMLLAAPFNTPAKTLAQLSLRYQGIKWGRGDLALLEEGWYKTRREKLWRIAPDVETKAPELLHERDSEDRYADPGDAVLKPDANGQPRLQFLANSGPQAETILLRGAGASAEGDRPFLDQFNLREKTKKRIFHSQAPYYEYVAAVLNDDGSSLLQSREAPSEQPNYYLRKLSADGKAEVKALTQFPHPYPQLQAVKKEQIRYLRKDGVELSGDLYLPPNYDPQRDGRLPLLMWAYPREFKSSAAASQVIGSPYQFNAISYNGALPFLAQGYAVLDRPTMPIVGEAGKEPNDTYLPQLIANAEAAVEEVVKRGVADRNKIAIGGHSYGAFMTANLLTHTRLFKAGLARSGAYNRTLTPFGFQGEERNFWDAKEIYQAMSPFNYAEKMKDALLIIHGEQDNNSGTFPIQSERLFQALKGLGATTRLVMLPNESHGYRARESVMHMLFESHEWLEKYVKNAASTANAK